MSSSSDSESLTNRPNKRQRTANRDRSRPQEIKRDEQVWLPDGNVVIVADDRVALRVLKSTLTSRSDVFLDLFSLPQPENEGSMDGCPVVHVPDDPNDMRCLLLVVCCGKK